MTKKKIHTITKDLFAPIEAEEILYSVGGRLYHGKKILTEEQRKTIIEGARTLRNDSVLLLLLKEMKYVCQKKIFDDSKGDADLLAGKMGLWFVDVLEKKINNLSQLR